MLPTQTLFDSPRHPRRRDPRYRELNAGKADFLPACRQPDSRRYAAVLGGLDYRVPAKARPLFRRIIAARRATVDRRTLRIADIGCSFGVNAALLKHDITLRSLFARYTTAPLRGMANNGLLRAAMLPRSSRAGCLPSAGSPTRRRRRICSTRWGSAASRPTDSPAAVPAMSPQ